MKSENSPIAAFWRLTVAGLLSVAGNLAVAQSTDSAQTLPGDQTVLMNPFEVTTTQGHGYVTTNATDALKTNQSIMDIPQGILVVTRDLIDDLGYATSSDLMQFVGVGNGFQGESMRMRGAIIGYAYVDDMPENQSYEDNIWVDSYTIIKGAAEVLYLNASLSGLVIKSSKKPLPYNQTIITGMVDEWGMYRGTFDSTGPIGTVGNAKLGYRLIGAAQAGDFYFYNLKNTRDVVFPEFQVDLNNTMVRVWLDFQNIYTLPNDMDLVTPQGKLYTGAGRREENLATGDTVHYQTKRTSFEFLQKISDNWQMRLQASNWFFVEDSPIVFDSGGDNWTSGLLTYTARMDNITIDYWVIIDDFNGHYNLGPVPNQDAFGFSYANELTDQYLWATSPFGTKVVPFASAAAINALQVPSASEFGPPANEGSHTESYLSEIYWQHTIDVVPRYLTLVGGLTWANITSSNVTDISLLPWQATDIATSKILHRVGAVLKPIPEISLYALNTTNIIPVTGAGALLEDGQLAPPQQGTGWEYGAKSDFLGGRISTDFSWFHLATTNGVVIGGTLPNGLSYYNPIGTTIQEGVDGDVSFALSRRWQVIVTYYAGHDRDQNNNPVSESWDNSWSFYNRYDFSPEGPLKGFSIGGGINRVGGKWISTGGLAGATAFETPYTQHTGEIKLHTGNRVDAFISYALGKHWIFKVNCVNILNEAYPVGTQTAYGIDPSPPTSLSFLTSYKF